MREMKFRVLWAQGFQYFDFDKEFSSECLDDIRQAQIYQRDFMQFTGLHDKNGKEIYEGDIVRLGVKARGPRIGTVIFSKRAAKFAVQIRRDGYRKDETHLISILNCEIIGNIHENHDLLTRITA